MLYRKRAQASRLIVVLALAAVVFTFAVPSRTYGDGSEFYTGVKRSLISDVSNLAGPQVLPASGSSGTAMIVEEHNGIARGGEVLSGGVPFAVGKLASLSGLCVKDSSGNAVPAQFSVLNRWWSPNYDDSIKWLQVVFPADVAAGGSSTYYLTTGTNPARRTRPASASTAISIPSQPGRSRR